MRLAIDSVIFIYAIEDSGQLGEAAYKLIRSIEDGTHSGVASVLCLHEVLTKPFRSSKADGVAIQMYLENIEHLDYWKVNEEIAIRSAILRSAYGNKLRLADAIHLATAIEAKAEVFVTNDRELARLDIAGIEIRLLGKLAD